MTIVLPLGGSFNVYLQPESTRRMNHSTLVIVHKDKQGTLANELCIQSSLESCAVSEIHDFAKWETCVREIAFAMINADLSRTEIAQLQFFSGKSAYSFALEVICGLHSPLLGETEVFGQFKELFERHWKLSPQSPLSKVFYELNRDAKEVRRSALQNLGHQSYPGLLRRKLKPADTVHIVGAGKLSSEIVQWLKKSDKDIHVHVRDLSKANEFKNVFPTVDVWSLDDSPDTIRGALVIAAPMKASEIAHWLTKKEVSEIYDLRGESIADPLFHPALSANLHELFAEIQSAKESLQEKVVHAKKLIQLKSHEALNTFRWAH